MDAEYEKLLKDFSVIAEALQSLNERAVMEYTPLVNDICSRNASKEEVDHLLTWMFDFVGYDKMLLLFKQVCRRYFYTYPEIVAYYILEYRKEYDRESLKGTEYEKLLNEDEDLED